MNRGWLVTVVVALISVLVVPPAIAQQKQDDEESLDLEMIGVEEATLREVEAYAKLHGVSLDTASSRLDDRAKISVFLADFMLRDEASFAGFALQPDGDRLRADVFVKGDASRRARALAADHDLIRLVDGRSNSLAELVELQGDLPQQFSDESFESTIDIESGTVVVSTTNIKSVRSVPDGIVVRQVAVLGSSDEHLYGGGEIGGCSAGFAVQSSGGYLSAGHCSNSGVDYFDPLSTSTVWHQSQSIGSWGDFQWFTSAHVDRPWVWYNTTQILPVYSVRPYYDFAQGDTFCIHWSWDMNSGGCALVGDSYFSKWVTEGSTGSSYYVWNLVAMDRDVTEPGVSGAPWMTGTQAVGVHQGVCGFNSCFSRADFVDEALGTSITLGP